MAYKLIITSFAVTLSAAFLLIDGYEIAIFAFLYATHMWASTFITEESVEADPFDILRYRPAVMQ